MRADRALSGFQGRNGGNATTILQVMTRAPDWIRWNIISKDILVCAKAEETFAMTLIVGPPQILGRCIAAISSSILPDCKHASGRGECSSMSLLN